MRVYISSDHGGFSLKGLLLEYLSSLGYDMVDLGPKELDPNDDYPKYVVPLAQKIIEDQSSFGVVICRNGVGVSITANRFKGIRCALSFNPKHAASSRNDDNSNVLALPADYISDKEAKEIVKTWLETSFNNKEERFVRRIDQVDNLRTQYE